MTSADYRYVAAILIATAIVSTALGILIGALWRRWRELAPPPEPGVDEHATRALAIVREKPPARTWHIQPCGCWCGDDGRTRVCPKHALEVQEIRDLLAWERERHQP